MTKVEWYGFAAVLTPLHRGNDHSGVRFACLTIGGTANGETPFPGARDVSTMISGKALLELA